VWNSEPSCAAYIGKGGGPGLSVLCRAEKCRGCVCSPGCFYAVVSDFTRVRSYSAVARYRKVTTWPLVQVASGPKVVSLRPLVTSFSTAQATAFM